MQKVTEYLSYDGFNKVLVFAPHMDDEIFGCGGLLLRLAQDEAVRLKIVYVSNGSKGAPENPPSKELERIRTSEALKMLAELGIQEFSFIGLPDGELTANLTDLRNNLFREITEFSPDLILIPHLGDEHEDHVVVADVVLESALNRQDMKVIGYEVWTKIESDGMYVSLIPEEYEEKMRLVEFYKSQIQLYDYRSYLTEKMLEHGTAIGQRYAEKYVVYS